MLTDNLQLIGDRLYAIRKKRGMTQAQVAGLAGVSERTYPEIERGIVNMRILTFVRICDALRISPDEVLIDTQLQLASRENDVLARLNSCSFHQRDTALQLLEVYFNSIEKN